MAIEIEIPIAIFYIQEVDKMQIYEKGNVIYGAFSKKGAEETEREGLGEKTLGQLIDDWNTNINYVRNTKTTWIFTTNIQKHLLNYYGAGFHLEEMTPKKIMEYMAYLKTEKEFSNNTVNKHRTHLMTLFEYMIVNDETYGLSVNPVRKVKALKQEQYHHHIYQPEEAREILEELRNSGNIGLEVAVSIALYCGCRREEVCALRWENVDMEKRIITICEVRTTAGKEIVEMNHTKNNTVRQIGIPDALYDVLERAKKYQKRYHRAFCPSNHNGMDFVLCEKDGTPWHPNNVTKRWSRFIKSKGFRYIRYHDLRHTNLSLLMTKMSAVDVAKLGGHKKVSTTTNIYGHSFNNAVENGVKTMNELL